MEKHFVIFRSRSRNRRRPGQCKNYKREEQKDCKVPGSGLANGALTTHSNVKAEVIDWNELRVKIYDHRLINTVETKRWNINKQTVQFVRPNDTHFEQSSDSTRFALPMPGKLD